MTKLKWGLLSTARINDRLIEPIRASARSELLAVASRDEQKAQDYANERQIPRAYGTYEQLLADPDVDIVYISLPNAMHVPWTVRCADAGKHVLCEKPLALTSGEVDRMAEAAERNRVIIQEAAMMRFHPQTRYMRELVDNRAIGDVLLIRGIFTSNMKNDADIRFSPGLGGGSLWDLGSYCVSFVRTVLQAEPVEVNASQIPAETDVDLRLSGQMRFDSGTLVHFYCSFKSFAHVEADLLGTEGRIQLNYPWVNQLGRTAHVKLIRSDLKERRWNWDDGMDRQSVETQIYEDVNAYQDEVDSVVGTVLDGTDPVIPLSDSRHNVAAMVALYESARTGKPVRL